jgi:alkylation response protein AidB-like acyl-CoA dehydrogenase
LASTRTEEQEALAESIRRFLTENGGPIEAITGPAGVSDPGHLAALEEAIGLSAIAIPEDHGGFGCGMAELAVVCEELGRALAGGAFFASNALALPMFLAGATEAQKQTWLPQLAEGALTAALALPEPGTGWDISSIHTTLENGRLNGTKRYVVGGAEAGLLLVVAQSGPDLAVALTRPHHDGVVVRQLPTLDPTRTLAEVELHDVVVDPSDVLEGGTELVQHGLAIAGALLASEQLGAAAAVLDQAVEYAKVRKQFGQPIGAFQAIAHKCADMMVRLECMRSAAWHAAQTTEHAKGPELTIASAIAQATCSEGFFRIAAENIQVHGGVGFTWEHSAHLYFKRARASACLLGDAAWHTEQFLTAQGIGR